ncbi:MAG: hypothetical protein KBG28_12910 [Kofleriaceae bacterium]|jgi:hypothetical protein|nr:hypothetical protein [Kofleriaceae bacterium]MBP6838383.1 hypothetical protein [Kofleriaceae bacterium]MBP9204863.1 hypothetical protein [Kofleriaceae bacterium]
MTLNMSGTPRDNRPTAMILAFVAAAALLFTVVSKRWLTMGAGDVGFGLTHFSACFNGTCDSKSNGEIIAELDRRAADAASSLAALRSEGSLGVQMAERSGLRAPEGGKSGFVPLGWITLLSTALGALALAGAAGLFASKKKVNLPVSLPGLALGMLFLSLLAAMIFVARKPGGREFGVGYTFWIFGVANVLGIVAAQILGKRPAEPLPDDLPL